MASPATAIQKLAVIASRASGEAPCMARNPQAVGEETASSAYDLLAVTVRAGF